MKNSMSPNDLEVLIHCYVSPNVHPRTGAPAVDEAIHKFLKDGIFCTTEEKYVYRVSSKGQAWLNMILSTPYPQERWVDPRMAQADMFDAIRSPGGLWW